MLLKKIYIPIGALIIAIVGIAFFALRSDTPKEPIVIIKTVTPARQVAIPQTPVTTRASLPIETETPVSDAEVSVSEMDLAVDVSDIEVSLSDILSKYPDYETMDAWNQANVRRWVRKDKILEALKAREAELERQLAIQGAQKELFFEAQSTTARLQREYPDVLEFIEKYPEPERDDFLREYPDTSERQAFAKRTIEASKMMSELADRFLSTPGVEDLPSEALETLHRVSLLDEVIEEVLE